MAQLRYLIHLRQSDYSSVVVEHFAPVPLAEGDVVRVPGRELWCVERVSTDADTSSGVAYGRRLSRLGANLGGIQGDPGSPQLL